LEREFDLFERFPDGSLVWRGHASGIENAQLKLKELAKETPNECIAMYLATQQIVARLNGHPSGPGLKKPVIFQIAYEERLSIARNELLRHRGYEVVSVMGNESAKVILSMPEKYDAFILGHAAPEPDRREMVRWLKEHYPKVPVLALNPPSQKELAGADFNVQQNGPEVLLSTITAAVPPHEATI